MTYFISKDLKSRTSIISTRLWIVDWLPFSPSDEVMLKCRSDSDGRAVIKFVVPWEPRVLYATDSCNSREAREQHCTLNILWYRKHFARDTWRSFGVQEFGIGLQCWWCMFLVFVQDLIFELFTFFLHLISLWYCFYCSRLKTAVSDSFSVRLACWNLFSFR